MARLHQIANFKAFIRIYQHSPKKTDKSYVSASQCILQKDCIGYIKRKLKGEIVVDKAQREAQLLDWINQHSEFSCDALEMVSGDASFRRYFRFSDQGKSIIAVDAPPGFEDSETFVNVAKAYEQHGVNVPHVYCVDVNLGFYCIEDFGNRQFASVLNQPDADTYYKRAFRQLPGIQSCRETRAGALPSFDDALLEREFHLFTHWLCEVHLNLTLTPEEQALLTEADGLLRENFFAQPQVGVHRDFHSRNLMLLDDDSVGVIDFQDAVTGPVTYDEVSLLRDCYQVWPDEFVDDLLRHVHAEYHSEYDFEQYRRWFDITGIQRHVKASGIFCRLWHRDGKQGYLKDIPATLTYIKQVAARYDEFNPLAEFVASRVLPNLNKAGN